MMVNRAVCEDCENQVDYITCHGDLACGECGGDLVYHAKVGSVTSVSNTMHAEALELASDWRHDRAQRAGSAGKITVAQEIEQCCDDLEDLVERKRAVPQEGDSA